MGDPKKQPMELLDLHDDCLEDLINRFPYPVIQTIRQTNKRFKDLIAARKPKIRLHEICVDLMHNEYILETLLYSVDKYPKLYPLGPKTHTKYIKDDKGCLYWDLKQNDQNRRHILDGIDHKKAFLKDLNFLLKKLAEPLNVFKIRAQCDPEEYEMILANISQPILAKKVVIQGERDFFVKALSAFEPGTLESIHLVNYSAERFFGFIRSRELEDMEQWRQAKHLKIDGLVIETNGTIQPFLHFSTMRVQFDELSMQDVGALKDDQIRHIDHPKHHQILIRGVYGRRSFDGIEHIFGEEIHDDPQEIVPAMQLLKDQMKALEIKARSISLRDSCNINTHFPEFQFYSNRSKSFSYFFRVPGRDVVLRMRCIYKINYHSRFEKLEFEFVAREEVDSERIIY